MKKTAQPKSEPSLRIISTTLHVKLAKPVLSLKPPAEYGTRPQTRNDLSKGLLGKSYGRPQQDEHHQQASTSNSACAAPLRSPSPAAVRAAMITIRLPCLSGGARSRA